MTARTILVSVLFATLIGVFSYAVSKQEPNIFITSPTVSLSSKSANMASVFFKIKNQASPDILLSAKSAFAAKTLIEKSEQFGVTAIPAGSSPIFSSDGIYLKLLGIRGDLKTGDLVPVTLSFQQAGNVNFKAIVTGKISTDMNHGKHKMDHSMPKMDHSMPKMDHSTPDMDSICGKYPTPKVSISAKRKPDHSGWRIDVTTDNFEFIKEQPDMAHIPGTGHAHVYLNGLKLQRLYGKTVHVGNLLPGRYSLIVALNTNTHRVYLNNGKPVISEVILIAE